jgi:cyanophycin synthetase
MRSFAQPPLSFSGLDLLVWRATALLAHNGVRAGEVLALWFAGELAGVLAMLAATRIGATMHWIPQQASRLAQVQLMADIRPAALLCDRAPEAGVSARRILIDPVALSRAGQAVDAGMRDPFPAAPWLVITGSGSTGAPKRIPITHAQFMAQTRTYNAALRLKPGDRVASLLSMDTVVTRERYLDALIAGASLVLGGSSQADTVAWLRHHEVSILWSTVLHAEAFMQRCMTAKRPALPSLRAFILGSSTVSESLRRRFRTGVTDMLYVYYGMNEIGLVTIRGPGDLFRSPAAVGAAAPDIRLEIVGSDGHVLPAGQIGLVRVSGPGMVSGYLDDEPATRHAFKDGWFYPSDMGRLDVAGHLDYLGRADELMIMDGINIYPAEIEKVLAAHPAVRDVAVIAVMHPVHQHVPIGAVTLQPEVAVSERDLHTYARERLGARCPSRVLILQRLPRNQQGKLLRAELGDHVLARLRTPASPENA